MPKIPPTNIKVHRELVKAFKDRNESPERFADYLSKEYQSDLSSRTVRNYFAKPEGSVGMVEKNIDALCEALLGIDYSEAITRYSIDLFDSDVTERYRRHLEEICGTIQVLDMDRPISLDGVYTEASFLESPKSRVEQKFVREAAISDSPKDISDEEKQIPATQVVEQNKRLMVLGTPGTGKSTLLRHLALHHLNNPLSEEEYFPVYLELRSTKKDKWGTLLDGVISEVENYIPKSVGTFKDLLEKGQILLLLDGLDEVDEATFDFLCQGIDELTNRYPDNRFIATCRTKSFSEYKFVSFSDYELASFSEKQRDSLIEKWFKAKTLSNDITGLNSEDEADWLANSKIEFQNELKKHQPIAMLASNPLTLTFLLYTFEYNNGQLAHRRLTLLQAIVDIFVREWDRKRRIRRRDFAPVDVLEPKTLIDLFCHIAYQGFTSPTFKTEWTSFELQDIITPFLKRVDINVDALNVIKAIEATNGILAENFNGIYSFQPLTFQEFFAALHIVEHQSEDSLRSAVDSYLLNTHWQEVFPLATDRLSNSDEFLKLIFSYMNDIPYHSKTLQGLLSWLDKTTKILLKSSATSSWAALLLALDLDTDLYTLRLPRNATINRVPFHELSVGISEFNKDRNQVTPNQPRNSIALWLAIIYALTSDHIGQRSNSSGFEDVPPLQEVPSYVRRILVVSEKTTIDGELKSVVEKAKSIKDFELVNRLESLRDSKPSQDDDTEIWIAWAESLRQLMLKEFNIGHQVRFTGKDYLTLEEYVYGNNLLLRCIRESLTSTASLRAEIVDSMLIPSRNTCSFPHIDP